VASYIKDAYNISHLSTGELYRKEISQNTSIGKLAKVILDRGELVPDDITIKIAEKKLNERQYEKGFLLDGYPRTIPQAEALDVFMKQKGWKMNAVINIVVADETLIKRISGRRTCSKCGALYHIVSIKPKIENICDQCGGQLFQRPDDTRETIARRIDVYRKQTQPLLEYYFKMDLLYSINGEGTIQENIIEIEKVFGGLNDND